MIKLKYKYKSSYNKQFYKEGEFKSILSFKIFFKNKYEKYGYFLIGFEEIERPQLDLFKNFN
jgi:hypothetical protein